MIEGNWIRRFRAAPEAPVRLVCLPHAGGAASYYRPLAMAMHPSADVLAVQYPGRQDRSDEPQAADFTELVDRTTAALLPELDRPVALFGHSMGSLLAFEVVKRLEKAGIAPLVLFASAGVRPTDRRRQERLRSATDEQLLADLSGLAGTEARLLDNEDMRALFLPPLRADYRMLATYEFDGTTVACPVVSLTGDNDQRVPVADAKAWAGHTTGRFDLRVFPGGHFYLADQWADVAGVIARRLAE
jgi:surfactin synthase thioesterase subunit